MEYFSGKDIPLFAAQLSFPQRIPFSRRDTSSSLPIDPRMTDTSLRGDTRFGSNLNQIALARSAHAIADITLETVARISTLENAITNAVECLLI